MPERGQNDSATLAWLGVSKARLDGVLYLFCIFVFDYLLRLCLLRES